MKKYGIKWEYVRFEKSDKIKTQKGKNPKKKHPYKRETTRRSPKYPKTNTNKFKIRILEMMGKDPILVSKHNSYNKIGVVTTQSRYRNCTITLPFMTKIE